MEIEQWCMLLKFTDIVYCKVCFLVPHNSLCSFNIVPFIFTYRELLCVMCASARVISAGHLHFWCRLLLTSDPITYLHIPSSINSRYLASPMYFVGLYASVQALFILACDLFTVSIVAGATRLVRSCWYPCEFY